MTKTVRPVTGRLDRHGIPVGVFEEPDAIARVTDRTRRFVIRVVEGSASMAEVEARLGRAADRLEPAWASATNPNNRLAQAAADTIVVASDLAFFAIRRFGAV